MNTTDNTKPEIAHCIPSYARHGGGYYVYITGIATFFARTIKAAKEFAAGHGCELIRL